MSTNSPNNINLIKNTEANVILNYKTFCVIKEKTGRSQRKETKTVYS